MDKRLALSKLRSLIRHAGGVERALKNRVDQLLTEKVSDGDRCELDFLTKTICPPAEAFLSDAKALERALRGIEEPQE